MRRGVIEQLSISAVTVVVSAALFVACGSSGSGRSAVTPTTHRNATTSSGPPEDLVMQASDFTNLKRMTHVRGFFVDNRLGHLAEALAIARGTKGGVYPVGTIVQLVPFEAMVKRRHGFNPATKDWEFFSLDVSADGTTIKMRGGVEVVNRFNKSSCAGCHGAAKPQFDMICEHDHGCAPLGVSDALIEGIQKTDPRP